MSSSTDAPTPLNPDPKDVPLHGAGEETDRAPLTEPDSAAVAVATPEDVLPLEYAHRQRQKINPWLFVPVLYFMQFLPNGVVTSLMGAVYKSLGVDNISITTWTGLAALPWVFKMFWGPLVDLNFTKRRWTLAMELAIAVTLLITAATMGTPKFFVFSVAAMFLLATFSATHDIACDGLYLMSLDKKRQAAFSGVMAASSRFGRLFIDSGIVVLAGWLIARGWQNQSAWVVGLGIAAVFYAAGTIWNFFNLPKPAADVPVVDVAPGERTKNVWRTVTIVGSGVVAYYFCNATIQLIGYAIYSSQGGAKLPQNWGMTQGEMVTEFVKVGLAVLLAPVLWWAIRKQVRGTPMGDAFVTYARQSGFGAILAFIIFYRFGEAMVFAMATLFILDKPEAGGLGISLSQLGVIKGIGQSFGLIFGGLLGGWWISKQGLRKAFWPLVVCMHVPNLLYVWAAYELPTAGWLFPVVFIEAFGYGVGFAGYFVYLMHVAQRGKFVTSHYAIGTGLGALFITFATILAGIVQSVFGYKGVFIAACLLTIPGALTLLFIPMDEEETKKVKAAGDH